MTYIELAIMWKKRGNQRMALIIRDSYKRMKLKEKALTVAVANA